ncbi:hypothetical protein C6P45_003301 [Maudiozyma exigua]|uniref:Cyclin-like domain-containing protein n=1 Tax=Maudiozyma exigua TaxID=34358 RepID=A0A9P6WCF1_MAUEX|nr:hypothetical protein C6P45_003301 [Kazachstania exigua]
MVSTTKAENVELVRRELRSHHNSMTEYSIDHFRHLFNLNAAQDKSGNLSNFKLQPQINTKMRALIFDFIMYSHTRLNLCTATLFLTFDILDRYASKFIVKSGNYQLLALTTLWLASKYWDAKHRVVNLTTLCQLCCNQYSKQNFRDMELHILKSLNWDLFQTTTYDAFIDMLLFMKNNNMVNPHEHSDKFPISSILNPNLNINEIKLGAIIVCELLSFDINMTATFDTYSLTKAVITLLTLSMNYHYFNRFDNLNDVCNNDQELVKIMNKLLQICSNQRNFPSSFKFKHFNMKKPDEIDDSNTRIQQSTAEKLLQFISRYNHKVQADEFIRLQQMELFNDPFSTMFSDTNSFTISDNDIDNDNEISSTVMSTPRPGSITPVSSVSSSSSPLMTLPLGGKPSYMATPMLATLGQSRSNSISTLAGIAPYLTRHRSSHGPITPTTPTMFRKPSIRKLSTASRMSFSTHPPHQRKRSSSSTDVQFEQYESGHKR